MSWAGPGARLRHVRNGSTLAAISLAILVASCSRAPDAAFVVSVPWGLMGRTVVIDTHTHTHFSDGARSPEELALMAAENGCDAIAITDHSDPALRAATPEYFEAIDRARERVPSLLIFAGVEWNIPPYAKREHVNVLLDPTLERKVLPTFKERFEGTTATASDALEWLAAQAGRRESVALIYNHPSRLDPDERENLEDLKRWQATGSLFIGFEGGPGHQKVPSPGDYKGVRRTESRWDPVVADVGGTWDALLDAGHIVWGALAVSDYHNDQLDFAPCEFARTKMRVPQLDHQGILAGLRSGSFWGAHGRIVDDLAFVAVHPDLGVPGSPGEIIGLSGRTMPVLRVKIQRGPDTRARPLRVEIIGNGISGKPERAAARDLPPGEDVFDWQPTRVIAGADGKSAYFRVRVMTLEDNQNVLVAYSNPIRFELAR